MSQPENPASYASVKWIQPLPPLRLSNNPLLAELPELRERFTGFIHQLQDDLCARFEALDGSKGIPGSRFHEDRWDRPEGGGGRSRVIENGAVLEKGGVNVSIVYGPLPDVLKDQHKNPGGQFFATGLSLVIHPWNPHVPTVHANWRMFILSDDDGQPIDAWFGGGCDLTPYYLVEEDATHFHHVQASICEAHGADLYPNFKQQCDQYFWNHHRAEARGIGGLFYDYLRPKAEGRSLRQWFDFVTQNASFFADAYFPVAHSHVFDEYSDAQRWWQEVRRGRYAEFNLIHDRGTLFGLRTNGRIESILMSMPPRARWVYNHQPNPGTPEAELLAVLRNPRNWLD